MIFLFYVSTFIFGILLCLTGYAAGVWSEAGESESKFPLKTAKHIWDGMHLFVLAKMGLGEAVHASGQRPKCAFPAKKTALHQWFFRFRDFRAGSTFAANNADKETFHMAEKNSSRSFFLLPIS
jgi:hypothetical protein